jgi:hypothetical protein
MRALVPTPRRDHSNTILNELHPVNRTRLTLLLAVVLSTSMSWAQPAPVTLTVQSYDALANGLTKVADAVAPGAADDALREFRDALGLQDLQGVDRARPWQVALWADDFSAPPSMSVRIPVTNFDSFRNGLQPGLLKGDAGVEPSIEQIGNYAKVWLEFGTPSASTRAAEKAWQPDSLNDTTGLLSLIVRPSDSLRTELVNGLAMGRMTIAMAFASQAEHAPEGLDVKTMGELMGAYFDMLETGLKGFQTFELGFDVAAESLVARQIVVPLAGSELAGWFQAQPGDLDALTPYLDRNAPMTLAMRFELNPTLLPTLKRFVALSMQLQGLAPDSDASAKTTELIESFLPMQFAGNLNFARGFEFNGLYRFPDKDPSAVYAQMKDFLQVIAKDQVGEDQPYRSVTLEPAQRKSHGLAIDRATFVLNPDAPMYQMPGQQEMLEAFWPDGTMIFDYALKADDLFMGSPASLDALLERAAASKPGPAAGLARHTVAYGHINPLRLLPSMLALNPMISEDDKKRFDQLNPAGCDIGFQLDLDGRFSSTTTIPIQLFRVLGQLAQ